MLTTMSAGPGYLLESSTGTRTFFAETYVQVVLQGLSLRVQGERCISC
jgi:hypothetical protein